MTRTIIRQYHLMKSFQILKQKQMNVLLCYKEII